MGSPDYSVKVAGDTTALKQGALGELWSQLVHGGAAIDPRTRLWALASGTDSVSVPNVDILLSALRDALVGAGSRSLSDLYTILGAGLPASQVAGRLDVNVGASVLPPDAATQATLAGVKAGTDRLDILLSVLRDDLRGAGARSFTDLYTAMGAGLPASLVGGRLSVDVGASVLPTGASTEATLALIKAKTDNLDLAMSALRDALRGVGNRSFTDLYGLLAGGLPAALVGGRLDMHVGNSPSVIPDRPASKTGRTPFSFSYNTNVNVTHRTVTAGKVFYLTDYVATALNSSVINTAGWSLRDDATDIWPFNVPLTTTGNPPSQTVVNHHFAQPLEFAVSVKTQVAAQAPGQVSALLIGYEE